MCKIVPELNEVSFLRIIHRNARYNGTCAIRDKDTQIRLTQTDNDVNNHHLTSHLLRITWHGSPKKKVGWYYYHRKADYFLLRFDDLHIFLSTFIFLPWQFLYGLLIIFRDISVDVFSHVVEFLIVWCLIFLPFRHR